MSEIWRGGVSLTEGLGALPTPAQRSLVRAATGAVSGIEDALQQWRSLVDLTGPIDGGSYRLIPLIFYRLQAAGIDDPNRGMFKGVYRRSMVENSRVLDAVIPAVRALSGAGITPWLAKGAALVRAGYYPTVASRPMSDVDVVVGSDDREDAVEVLRSIGFLPLFSDRVRSTLHAATFVNDLGLELDLHWHFLHHARSTSADEIITRTSQSVDLEGIPVRVAGPTGLLIATAVHGMISNAEPPVRWLVDASLIFERNGDDINWDDVVEFATRFRLARRIERALQLLSETTGHATPAATMAALSALPTSTVERLEHRISTAPWNSVQGSILLVLAGYAGGDRQLHNLATGLPRYLARRWDLEHLHQVPAAGARRLTRQLRPGRP